MELTSGKVSRVDVKPSKEPLVEFDESTDKANLSIADDELMKGPETDPDYQKRRSDLKDKNNLSCYICSFCVLSLILGIFFNLISLLVLGDLSETHVVESKRDQRVQ